jgi:hypothetical protein
VYVLLFDARYSGGDAQEANKPIQEKHRKNLKNHKKPLSFEEIHKICLNRSKRKTKLADLFDEFPMLLFVLEAGVALLVLILIVVWTMMGRKEDGKRK